MTSRLEWGKCGNRLDIHEAYTMGVKEMTQGVNTDSEEKRAKDPAKELTA